MTHPVPSSAHRTLRHITWSHGRLRPPQGFAARPQSVTRTSSARMCAPPPRHSVRNVLIPKKSDTIHERIARAIASSSARQKSMPYADITTASQIAT